MKRKGETEFSKSITIEKKQSAGFFPFFTYFRNSGSHLVFMIDDCGTALWKDERKLYKNIK